VRSPNGIERIVRYLIFIGPAPSRMPHWLIFIGGGYASQTPQKLIFIGKFLNSVGLSTDLSRVTMNS
jgi:hypothetical protein